MNSLIYKNHITNFILIAITGIVIGIIRYFALVKIGTTSFSYNFLFDFITIQSVPVFVETLVLSVGFVFTAYYLIFFNNNFAFVENSFQLPGFIYILFCGFFPANISALPALVSSVLLLSALNRLFPVYRKQTVMSNCFDAGFLIALSSFFYPFSILFLLLAFITMIIIRPFKWREYSAIIFGAVTPFFFLFCIIYLFGKINLLSQTNTAALLFAIKPDKFSVYNISYMLGLLIPTLVVLVYYLTGGVFKKVVVRRYLSVLALFLVVSVIIAVIPFLGAENYVFAIIPLSYLLSHLFVSAKSKFLRTLIWVVVILSFVAMQFSSLFGLFNDKM